MIPEVNYSIVYKFSIISYPLFLFFTSILKNKWIIVNFYLYKFLERKIKKSVLYKYNIVFNIFKSY